VSRHNDELVWCRHVTMTNLFDDDSSFCLSCHDDESSFVCHVTMTNQVLFVMSQWRIKFLFVMSQWRIKFLFVTSQWRTCSVVSCCDDDESISCLSCCDDDESVSCLSCCDGDELISCLSCCDDPVRLLGLHRGGGDHWLKLAALCRVVRGAHPDVKIVLKMRSIWFK
jgi:hypothetical protein